MCICLYVYMFIFVCVSVCSARANPKEFRDEVTRRLTDIRDRIRANPPSSGSGSIPHEIASRIVAELTKIRSDVLTREAEHNQFKAKIRQNLTGLRPDIIRLEEENKELKKRGGRFSVSSDRIPPKLQVCLVVSVSVFFLKCFHL